MTLRFILDEMLSPKIASQLQGRGHDVFAIAARRDLVGTNDAMVLELAAEERRTVVTLNIADFAVLHSDWQLRAQTHCGILFVPSATFPQDKGFVGAIVEAVDTAAKLGAIPGENQTAFLHRVR